MTFFRKLFGLPEKNDGYLQIPLSKDMCEQYHWIGKKQSKGNMIIEINEQTITITKKDVK